jgi:hypothetical protein
MQPLQTAGGQSHAGEHAGSLRGMQARRQLVDGMGHYVCLLPGAASAAAAVQGLLTGVSAATEGEWGVVQGVADVAGACRLQPVERRRRGGSGGAATGPRVRNRALLHPTRADA